MRSILFIFFISITVHTSAQFYPLEAGLVGGLSSGLNFRAYLDDELSYEALLSFRNNGAQFHLLRQQHSEIFMSTHGNIYFVYGYGAHLGFYYSDHYTIFLQDIYFGRNIFSPAIGADGYAGIEYRFQDLPFSCGLRFKPYMELSLQQIFSINIWDFGVTVKYRFQPNNAYY